MHTLLYYFFFFFFNDTATTEIYTLSLHDALPICAVRRDHCREEPTLPAHGVHRGSGGQAGGRAGLHAHRQLPHPSWRRSVSAPPAALQRTRRTRTLGHVLPEPASSVL